MSTTQNRVSAGVPTGGQFATTDRPEATTELLFTPGDTDVRMALSDVTTEYGVTTIRFPDGEMEVRLDDYYTRADHIDPVADLLNDGTIRIAFASPDESGQPYEWVDGWEFEEFRSEDERDAYIDSVISDNPDAKVFVVEHFEHSLHRFSVLGEPGNLRPLSDRWDSRPSGVIVVPAEVAEHVDPREAADAALSEYTSWANGDVYGIATITLGRDGETLTDESCWGFIGTSYVESCLESRSF